MVLIRAGLITSLMAPKPPTPRTLRPWGLHFGIWPSCIYYLPTAELESRQGGFLYHELLLTTHAMRVAVYYTHIRLFRLYPKLTSTVRLRATKANNGNLSSYKGKC